MWGVDQRAETVLSQLLQRFARNGDAAAMEEFVGRTRRRLLAAARLIGNPQEAEDCVQAVKVKTVKTVTSNNWRPSHAPKQNQPPRASS